MAETPPEDNLFESTEQAIHRSEIEEFVQSIEDRPSLDPFEYIAQVTGRPRPGSLTDQDHEVVDYDFRNRAKKPYPPLSIEQKSGVSNMKHDGLNLTEETLLIKLIAHQVVINDMPETMLKLLSKLEIPSTNSLTSLTINQSKEQSTT